MTLHLKGKVQQLCGRGRGRVLETRICTREQILDSLVYLTSVNPVHVEVEIRAEQDLLEILALELFRVKILVLILLDAF